MKRNRPATADDLHILVLVKGDQRFLFLYREDERDKVLRAISRCAFDKRLTLNWFDASVLAEKVRARANGNERQER